MERVIIFIISISWLVLSVPCSGQETKKDSTIVQSQVLNDSTSWLQVDSVPGEKKHSPRKATIYSLVLPGLGQAYNRQYWKIPIIYGIGAVCVYFMIDNHQNWVTYNNYLNLRTKNDNNPLVTKPDQFLAAGNEYDPFDPRNPVNIANPNNRTYKDATQIQLLRDGFRRDRDFSVIILALTYTLNIVDATVFAHLREFKVGDKVTMKIDPTFRSTYFRPTMELKCSLTF